jgi:hypothetical protein
MTSTAKVSVAIGRAELAWARTLARREGKSLSAVVTESLAERRRLTALAEVVVWMAEAQAPLTDDELNAAQRAARPRRKHRCPPPKEVIEHVRDDGADVREIDRGALLRDLLGRGSGVEGRRDRF